MIRKWTSKIRKSVSKGVVSSRRKMEIPIKLSLEPDKSTGNLRMPFENLSITGKTVDLSVSGIGFVVSSIRLREYYLVGEGRRLKAELNLPNGKVKMMLVGLRYEQTRVHASIAEYLVGAKIVSMSEGDREIYKEFLSKKKYRAGSLELGVDQS